RETDSDYQLEFNDTPKKGTPGAVSLGGRLKNGHGWPPQPGQRNRSKTTSFIHCRCLSYQESLARRISEKLILTSTLAEDTAPLGSDRSARRASPVSSNTCGI